MNSAKQLKQMIDILPDSIVSDLFYNLEDILDDSEAEIQLKPKVKKNHIGVEIECFSHIHKLRCYQLLIKHKLAKYVNIGYDGSIDTDNNEKEYELRVLIPESQLKVVLKRLGLFLKEGRFRVNDSCGLHVHLDMRQRKMMDCYEKLLKVQDILFGLVNKNRWNNQYCKYTNKNANNRFTAINKESFQKHKTIEVRLHHGSIDVKEIGNWINLLLKAINTKSPQAIKNRVGILKWTGKNKKLRSYVKSKFNPEFFKIKNSVVDGSYRQVGFDDGDY